MDMLTELFVSPRQAAAEYGPASAARFERVQLSGLTNLEFETLWAILEGEEWDVEDHALREVASTDASWIHEFPDPYLDLLTRLTATAMHQAAAEWARTEEMAGSAADVFPILEQLVTLSRSAVRKGQRLFVWVSM